MKQKRKIKVLYLYNSPRQVIQRKGNFYYEQNYAFYGLNSIRKFGIKAKYSDKGFQNNIFTFICKRLSNITLKIFGVPIDLNQVIVLSRIIRKTDIIFATAQRCGYPLAVLKYLGIIKIPVVLTSIGLSEYLISIQGKKQTLKFFRKIFYSVDKIICYSMKEKKELIKHLSLSSHKVEFIPFGVDTEYFSPVDNIKPENFILSIGADSQRDFKTLFQAIKDLPIKLTVITFPKNLRGLNIPENIKVFYKISFYKIKWFYAKSQFVIIPVQDNSYSGGTTSLLQSMAMAKAVIVSKTGAIRQGYSLRDKFNCLLVRPGDIAELRKAILYLIDNPDECIRIGKNARKTVENKYNLNNYVKTLSRIFKDVYEENRRRKRQ